MVFALGGSPRCLEIHPLPKYASRLSPCVQILTITQINIPERFTCGNADRRADTPRDGNNSTGRKLRDSLPGVAAGGSNPMRNSAVRDRGVKAQFSDLPIK